MSIDLRQESVTYRVEMELLSPLHVGSGRKLLQGIDWIEHQGRVYVANQEALLEEMLPETGAELDASAVDHLVGMKLGDMINELQRARRLDWYGPCFRYSLPGRPMGRTPQEISEQIKDSYGRPYLPGSSLKGALRSLLARHVVADESRQIRIHRKYGQRGLDRRAAADKMEQNLFVTRTSGVNESNYDLWRAVQVADSKPVDDPNWPALALAQVNVYPPRSSGRPRPRMNVEVLRTGTRLTATLKLDHTMFTPLAEERLRFGGRRRWLEELAKRAQNDAKHRLVEEVSYFYELRKQGYDKCPVENFLDDLADRWRDLGSGEFLMQVGWGPGWMSKTLGGTMRKEMGEKAFVKMANDFRLAWDRHQRRSKWVKNGLAPLTRRLATVSVDGEQSVPLGWMKVRLEHRREQAVLGDQLPNASSSGWRIEVEEEPVKEPAAAPVVSRPEHLQEGMVLEGTVRNVVKFGAFVDIGVGRDGLVHVSQLAEGHVGQVEDVVRRGQQVRVRVLNVERREGKWRIGLTMKGV